MTNPEWHAYTALRRDHAAKVGLTWEMSNKAKMKNHRNDVMAQNMGPRAWAKYWATEILSRAFFRALHLAEKRKKTVQAIFALRHDLKTGTLHRSNYDDHYTEEAERATWEQYRWTFREGLPETHEVIFRAQFALAEILQIIANDPSVKNVVNFGSAYGWLEHEIAKKASNVRVWGVDRRRLTKDLNSSTFSEPNLKFVEEWDILDFILQNTDTIKDSIFCHINIGVYFLPKFLSAIYNDLYKGGAKYIFVLEPSGVSRQTNRFYRYSLTRQDPVVFRSIMLLNNYPKLLSDAGFDLLKSVVKKPPHPDPDFRSVCFMAKRRTTESGPGNPGKMSG